MSNTLRRPYCSKWPRLGVLFRSAFAPFLQRVSSRPPALEHLTWEQWMQHGNTYWEYSGTIFEWLEAEGLPPVPLEKYDPESQRWVEDMPLMEMECYLNRIRQNAQNLQFDSSPRSFLETTLSFPRHTAPKGRCF